MLRPLCFVFFSYLCQASTYAFHNCNLLQVKKSTFFLLLWLLLHSFLIPVPRLPVFLLLVLKLCIFLISPFLLFLHLSFSLVLPFPSSSPTHPYLPLLSILFLLLNIFTSVLLCFPHVYTFLKLRLQVLEMF